MSGYTGSLDDPDGIERRIQEELRARQAASARVTGALSRTAGFTDRAYMSSLIADAAAAGRAGGASSFYARQAVAAAGAHSSPFARPYSALSSQQTSPYVGHNPSDAVAATLYAGRGYGYPGYGSHEIFSPHFGRSAQEMSLIDRYNAQQRQADAALLQKTAVGKSPAANLAASYIQKGSPKLTPSKSGQPKTPSSAGGTPQSKGSSPPSRPSSQPRPRAKSTSSSRSSPKPQDLGKVLTVGKDGEVVMEEPTKWYSGCVPLGVEDDKYWLSELQVYLRDHFAEAFGATEEDIAAPMHGRNKPIALGQVGIRCMHCKREYFNIPLHYFFPILKYRTHNGSFSMNPR
jgi:hypothetical protein